MTAITAQVYLTARSSRSHAALWRAAHEATRRASSPSKAGA